MATGHLEKRSKSSYTMVIDYGREVDPETGKGRQIREYRSLGDIPKTQAQAILIDTLAEINRGTYVEPITTKVADYVDTWVKHTAAPNVKPRTCERYESIVRLHIRPATLGNMSMSDVRAQHIRAFDAAMEAKGLAVSTRREIHVVIRAAFRQASADGDIARDPTVTVKAPKGPMGQGRDLTDEEVDKLLTEAANVGKEGRPRKRDGRWWLCRLDEVVWAALAIGTRMGEQLGLQKSDLHLVRGEGKVSISRALNSVPVEKGRRSLELDDPKSPTSIREVPIDDATVDMLRGVCDRHPFKFVFCHNDGSPLAPSTVTHLITRIARKAGLEGVSLHSTRHTFCTRAIRAGVDIVTTQELAGHGSITTTRKYAHTEDQRKRVAADLIGKSLKLGKRRLSDGSPDKKETQS